VVGQATVTDTDGNRVDLDELLGRASSDHDESDDDVIDGETVPAKS